MKDSLELSLDAVRSSATRSRAAFAALNVLMLVLAATWFNAKWGWNKVRIDIREYSKLASAEGKRVDKAELAVLRNAEFDDLERINIPTLGLTFAEGDIGMVGISAMIVIMLWLYLSMLGQAHTLADILFPVAASDTEARQRYGWKRKMLAQRRERVIAVADTLPHQFAFVGTAHQPFSAKYFQFTCWLAFVMVLFIVSFEMYTTFIKGWYATGGGMSVWNEIISDKQPTVLKSWAPRIIVCYIAQGVAALILVLLTHRICNESVWIAATLSRPHERDSVKAHLAARKYVE